MYVQLRAVGVALSMNGGNAAALSGAAAAVFKTIPKTYQEKFVEIFKTPGSFPQKAASFPLISCLAAMVSFVQCRMHLGCICSFR